MNKVTQMGRITKDIEVRYSQAAEPLAVAKFSIAVPRKFKRQNEPDCDFFNCVAFGKTAENINKFFAKGRMICVIGSLKNGEYEKDGRKVYTTDIVVEEFYFTGEKKADGEMQGQSVAQQFSATSEPVEQDDLPF